LILSKEKTKETGKDKTSIIFSVKHEAGALFRVVEKFQDYKINLTKIESRPTKNTPWEYNFYVDFDGYEKNPKISKVLKKIKKETLLLKVLGSYPSAELI
jgi:prephenate dehydratase